MKTPSAFGVLDGELLDSSENWAESKTGSIPSIKADREIVQIANRPLTRSLLNGLNRKALCGMQARPWEDCPLSRAGRPRPVEAVRRHD